MPDSPDILLQRAAAHYHAREYDAAGEYARAILDQVPAHFDALHLLGWLSQNQSRFADAHAYLTQAAQLQPGHVSLNINRINTLQSLRRFAESETVAHEILASHPGHIGALNALGISLWEQKRAMAAIEVYQVALAEAPSHAPAHFNMAKALASMGRLAEAEASYRAALVHAPPETSVERLVIVVNGLASVLIEQDQPDEALALLRDQPALDNEWNIALALLLLGDYAEGWRAYESRWRLKEATDRPADAGLLDLAAVAGKRVLLTSEQGHGDIIQFARYATLLADRGAIVSLRTYDGLKQLLSSLRGVALVIGEDEHDPPHDLTTPLLSLPLAFGTTVETIPITMPYLHADPAASMPALEPRIGLVWHTMTVSPKRMALVTLEPVLACSGISFHILQPVIPAVDQPLARDRGIHDHGDIITNFAATATLIETLDLVITIDTAVAHLAGALGKPVWVMLLHAPDWRWLRHRTDNPWYPTARLFRQPTPGDWDSVARAVALALEEWRDSATPPAPISSATTEAAILGEF